MSNQKNFRIHWFWAWVETHDSSGNVGFTQCIFLNFALWGGKGFSVNVSYEDTEAQRAQWPYPALLGVVTSWAKPLHSKDCWFSHMPRCSSWLFTSCGPHSSQEVQKEAHQSLQLTLYLCPLPLPSLKNNQVWDQEFGAGLCSELYWFCHVLGGKYLAWSLSWSGPLSWAFSAILDHNVALVVLRPCPELLTSSVYLYMINKELHHKQKFVSKAISNQRYFWKANSHDDFIGCCSDFSIHFWFRSSFTCIKDWLNICHMPDTVLGEDT